MSIHRECGEEIKWAHRDDDPERWQPPLEYQGQFFIIDERGVAIQVTGYKRHVCDPEKMEAWITYQERMAELEARRPKGERADRSLRDMARGKEQLERKQVAEKVKCPRCDAPRKSPCINLTLRRKGVDGILTNWPHPERYERATEG